MMSENDMTYNLNSNSPIPLSLIQRYLKGEATDKERAEVERLIKEDELFADAIEGFALMDDLDKSGLIIQDIKKSIAATKVARQRKANIRSLAVAAGIIALITVSGLVYFNISNKTNQKIYADKYEKYSETDETNDHKISDTKENIPQEVESAQPLPEITVEDDEISKKDRIKYKIPDDEIAQPPAFKEDKSLAAPQDEIKEIQENEPLGNNSTIAEEGYSLDAELQKRSDNPEEERIFSEFNDSNVEDEAVNEKQLWSKNEMETSPDSLKLFNNDMAELSEVTVESTKGMNKSKKQKNDVINISASEGKVSGSRDETRYINQAKAAQLNEAGKKAYDENDYETSQEKFSQAKDLDPDNIESHFYLGLSQLESNNAKEAIKSLNKVIKASPNDYSEAAIWYAALANIKLNKRGKAKSLLQNLVDGDGEYKQQAIDLLDSFN